MEYIEKAFPKPEMLDSMGGIFTNQPENYEDLKAKMNTELPLMRKMMGGMSKHIAQKRILMEDRLIQGLMDAEHANEQIKIRIYTPIEAKENRPLVMFFHGGGWFGGSLWAVEEYCKGMADQLDGVVISVEYHLAPEYPFPWGFDDCYIALAWAWENADSLGISKKNITVSGDSAGGNLAAAVSIKARDIGKIHVKNQILLYPVVKATEEGIANPSNPEGTTDWMGKVVAEWYLDGKPEWENPYISPLLCADLTHLPNALVVICEFDGLKHEGKEYAEALSKAGNVSKCILYKNTFHAFIDEIGVLPQGEDLLREVTQFILGN